VEVPEFALQDLSVVSAAAFAVEGNAPISEGGSHLLELGPHVRQEVVNPCAASSMICLSSELMSARKRGHGRRCRLTTQRGGGTIFRSTCTAQPSPVNVS
jgi:hypothetical protein